MEFNYIELRDLERAFPNKINIETHKIGPEKYIKLYNMYRSFFSQYIIKLFNLKKMDNIIKKSELRFQKVNIKNMDMYQYFTSKELDYIYLRNNIYIERLNNEEIEYLEKFINCKDLILDKQVEKFIDKTFKKVIFEDILGNGKIANISYGSDAIQYYLENNTLVIGLRHDEFFKGKLTDEEWYKQYIKKNDFLYNFIQEAEDEFKKEKLEIPIRMILYNNYSINKIN